MNRFLATAFSSLCFAPAAIHAASIYVFATDNAGQDAAVIAKLRANGHDPFLGQRIDLVTNLAAINLYDAIYFQPNYSYSFNWPAGFESAVVNYVNAGGGFVTSEWSLWMQATGRLPTVSAIYPSVATSSWDSASNINYAQTTADPIMNAGVPASFVCPTTSIAGVRTLVAAVKSGATSFYSDGAYKAVTGWNQGNGRVVNFHTVNGPAQLANANFTRLLGNSFRWVTSNPPTGPGVSGHITFQDWVTGVAPSTATFRYVNFLTGITAGGVTGSVSANGDYTIPGPNVPGNYVLYIKSGHWLRSSVVVTTSTGNTFSAAPVSLINGDADGDNEVGPGDFGTLSSAYGAVNGDFNWNPNSDFDGDGEVGPGDFGILSSNYGAVGD